MTSASEYVGHYGITAQAEGESEQAFRERVAGQLRDQNLVIEAHEVIQNARWDDPESGGDVMNGVIGAMAQALSGVNYGSTGNSQVGDDIASGIYVQSEKPKTSASEDLLIALMFGGRRNER